MLPFAAAGCRLPRSEDRHHEAERTVPGTGSVRFSHAIGSRAMTASAFSVLAFGFSGAQWILLAVFVIPVLILWGYAIVSLVGRPDLGIGAKLLWLLAIVVLPLIGSILYFMLRPAPQEQNRRAQAQAQALTHYPAGRA